MAKRTTINQSNLTGTRAAEWLLQKKKIVRKDDECHFSLLNLHGQIYEKRRLGVCVAKSVMSGTTKCALARKAWGNSFVVDDATNQNCTTKWSDRNCTKEVHFRSTVRSFLIFLNDYNFI